MLREKYKNFTINAYFENSNKSDIYRLWYQVYYTEMNRNSKYADHKKQTVIDDLEPNSVILTFEADDNIIGSSRIHKNFLDKNHYYYDLYQLDLFEKESFCVVSKYMILESHRKTNIGYLLALSTVDYCKKNNIKWIIMDCSPAVYDYFEKLGFIQYRQILQSPEYGEVKVMKFDVFSKNISPLNKPEIINKYQDKIFY